MNVLKGNPTKCPKNKIENIVDSRRDFFSINDEWCIQW